MRITGVLILALALCGCNSSVDSTDTLSSALSREVDFKLYLNNNEFNCSSKDNDSLKVHDFRFFIAQDENVDFLEFVNAEKCRSRLSIQNLAIDRKNSSLNFSLGVPAVLNHQNPVKASYPLNQSAMHWQWLSGYKFLRLEFSKTMFDQAHLNRFHLGSWGCSGKLPDNVACKQPNQIAIKLNNFIESETVVEVHLDALLQTDSESLCMGNSDNVACAQWMQSLQTDVFKLGIGKE